MPETHRAAAVQLDESDEDWLPVVLVSVVLTLKVAW